MFHSSTHFTDRTDPFVEVRVYYHEMFDENGNVIPDEILAVRFENDYDYDEDDEEENS